MDGLIKFCSKNWSISDILLLGLESKLCTRYCELPDVFLLVGLVDFDHRLFVASSMVDSGSNRFLAFYPNLYRVFRTHLGLVDRGVSSISLLICWFLMDIICATMS
jgi:hypothetical protein